MSAAPPKASHRERLLGGLAESIREKGLQRTQISDVVRHAHTSRRTFYECFADKESCFVELIRASSVALVAEIRAAVDPDAGWETQVDQAIDAYLDGLARDPAVTATISRELPTLGARGAALQHEGVERFAGLVVALAGSDGMRAAGVRPVPLQTAVMLVGGMSELVVRAIHRGEGLAPVAATAKAVVKAVIDPAR